VTVSPALPTLVGREADVERVDRELDDAQLVTIVGAPGIGKSRLARRVAEAREPRMPGGVRICDVTDTRTATDLVAAVAHALDLRLTGEDETDDGLIEAVGMALGVREATLVVADNCEHVVAHAARAIGRWIGAAPRVRFLVTSREPLLLEPERRYALEPLSEEDGARLFVLRARTVSPLPLDPADPNVRRIATRLEGNPLAIELAAMRADVLAPAQLLERLSARFALLTSSPRDAPARHATLRAALEWSWELLAPVERSALAQASVFRGGFSLEAAEAILRLDEPGGVLDVLHALRRKSLLQARPEPRAADELRFTLLESIRELGVERLAERPDATRVAERHAAYYASASERWGAVLHGPHEAAALARLALEHDNLISAYRTFANDHPRVVVHVALGLHPLLARRGPAAIHRELLDGAVQAAASLDDPALEARARTARARWRIASGRSGDAESDLARAFPLAPAAGGLRDELDRLALRVEWASGSAAWRARYAAVAPRFADPAADLLIGVVINDYTEIPRAPEIDLPAVARALEAAVALRRDRGDRRGEALALCRMSVIAAQHQLRIDGAIAMADGALACARELGDRRQEGKCLQARGHVLLDIGRIDDARTALEGACVALRDVGEIAIEAHTATLLAACAIELGDHDGASGLLHRAVAVHDRAQSHRLASLARLRLAWLHLEQGRVDDAVAELERALEASRGREVDPLVHGLHAAALAEVDRVDAATAAQQRAREAMLSSGTEDARTRAVLAVLDACVELARGRLSRRTMHVVAAEASFAAAQSAARDAGSATRSPLRTHDLRLSLRALERRLARDEDAARAVPVEQVGSAPLRIGSDGSWFSLPGASVVRLGARRGALRLILQRLGALRESEPGRGLTWQDVLAVGWPGDAIELRAGFSRVRTAMHTLRRLGLGTVIDNGPSGYLIRPEVPIERVPVGRR